MNEQFFNAAPGPTDVAVLVAGSVTDVPTCGASNILCQ